MSEYDQKFPAQEQEYPGTTDAMTPRPADEMEQYVGRGLPDGKRALVTGGDSARWRSCGETLPR